MKYMQTGIGKYIGMGAACLVVCFSLNAQPNAYIEKADALFKSKQYTQSFELYDQLFKQGKYSPAMLLRMAYIQEGSGHISKALFYLSLYYKASRDERTLAKIDELATNNKLEGYGITPADRFFTFLEDNFLAIAGFLISGSVVFMALALVQKRKRQPVGIFLAMGSLIMGILFLHINFAQTQPRGITAEHNTYLMNGPSAGASVVAIIPDGNQLRITGQKDVWLRVQWAEDEVWVRDISLWREKL